MKILKYLFLFIFVALYNRVFGQINYNATTNTGQYSSAIGDQTKSTNLASFASGFKSEANGKYASAFGEQTKANEWGSFASGYKSEATGQFAHALGLFAKAEYTASIAMGKYVRSSSSNAIVLGVGYGTSELVNNYGNTMMIGFNSTKPTFFVSRNETTQPDGLGKIGIGTITPGSLLQVNGATAMGYDAATIAPANGLLVSGNTGIGTTTVGSKLQINGNAAIGYSSSTAAPANGLLISGNLGIGTTAATTTEKLTVDGNIALVSSDNGIILKSPDGSN